MELFVGNSLWHLIVQSDGVSKLVLLLLLGMSVLCWTVFLCKAIILRIKKNHYKAVIKDLNNAYTVQEVVGVASNYAGTLPAYFISKNLVFLNTLLKSSQTNCLEDIEKDMMLYQLDQSVDSLLEDEKKVLPLLATCAGVAPLLGLFGTVWGLVHAFMRISEKQVADITTVAPGIAEALMTTLAGLLVAIPALIMFNYLQVHLRGLERLMIVLSDHIGVVVQQLTLQRKMHVQNQAAASRSADSNGHIAHSSY